MQSLIVAVSFGFELAGGGGGGVKIKLRKHLSPLGLK